MINGGRAADAWQYAPHNPCDFVKAFCSALLCSALAWAIPDGHPGLHNSLGQLQSWLVALISNVFGVAYGEYLFRSPRAMQVAFIITFSAFELLLVFILLNWLLARHVGRTFGGFRLVLQRVQ